jgi:hypothetical protein
MKGAAGYLLARSVKGIADGVHICRVDALKDLQQNK